MIGEVASFSNALSNAFTNTLGGKSTQLSNWRNTLRYSSSIALVIICFVILFNFQTLTLRVFALGFAAGFIGGLGLPFIYKAISTGAVSFVGPVVALTQSFFLIMFAVIVKNESLSLTFPIAAALGAVGIYLCSRQAVGNQPVTFSIFLLAATAAVFFSGFSFIATEIDNSQILGGLVGARFGVFALTFVFPPKKGFFSLVFSQIQNFIWNFSIEISRQNDNIFFVFLNDFFINSGHIIKPFGKSKGTKPANIFVTVFVFSKERYAIPVILFCFIGAVFGNI